MEDTTARFPEYPTHVARMYNHVRNLHPDKILIFHGKDNHHQFYAQDAFLINQLYGVPLVDSPSRGYILAGLNCGAHVTAVELARRGYKVGVIDIYEFANNL